MILSLQISVKAINKIMLHIGAARIVCYGFLAIIGVISLFNIVNSISRSVSARIKQYGAMRAVGMDNRQLKRMISAEAYTYAISGLIV